MTQCSTRHMSIHPILGHSWLLRPLCQKYADQSQEKCFMKHGACYIIMRLFYISIMQSCMLLPPGNNPNIECSVVWADCSSSHTKWLYCYHLIVSYNGNRLKCLFFLRCIILFMSINWKHECTGTFPRQFS